MENPAYYAILPASVRYDNRLKPMEKLLFAEITALSNKDGYCYATNAYFAKLYTVHKNTAGNWVSALVAHGYLQMKLIYKPGGKEVQKRLLYPINENIDTPQRKDGYPPNENIDTPPNENIEDNNTRVNNTSNNNKSIKNEIDYAAIETKLIDKYGEVLKEMKYPLNVAAYKNFLGHRKEKKNAVTKRGATGQIKMLCRYPLDVQEEIIDKSVNGGYLGIFEPKEAAPRAPQGQFKTGGVVSDYFKNKPAAGAIDAEVC